MPTSEAPTPNAVEQLGTYRRASNYIAAAMIYLQDNSLLEEPLEHEHIKHRLLGHWGTVPGINLIYAGLNRLILETQASFLLLTGPGHGAPANLANLWIDGCLEDVYPELSRDRAGLAKLIRDFSWPGGFPSHVAPIVPGTIHEGGELGYALATAFGAVLDNPDLIAAAIIGDGEAETGPTAGAWHSNKFLDPGTSGAVLPILHLNGYKIANPTIFKSMSDEELTKLFEGYGWHPLIVAGPTDELDAELAAALDTALRRDPRAPGAGARRRRAPGAPALADDRAEVAQGLDRPQGGRRHPGRGDLEGAPGAGDEGEVGPRPPEDPRGLAALVRPEPTCSTRTAARPRRSSPPARRATCGWGRTRTSTAGSCARTSSSPTLDKHALDVSVARAGRTAAR